MKILHVTFGIAPYSTGGLPAYVRDLVEEEIKMQNEVFILKPGAFSLSGKLKIIENNNIFEIVNSLPVPSIFGIGSPLDYMIECDKNIYKEFLLKLKPDIIHVHSMMGIHKEFFEVAKELKIKMVYTTHDYFGLCLKVNYIDRDNNICMKNDCEKCAKCNYGAGLSKKKIFIMQSKLYNKIKALSVIKKTRSILRKKTVENIEQNKMDSIISNENLNELYKTLLLYYKSILLLMDYFHFNSEVSKDIFESKLGSLNGEVLPITLSSIKDNRKVIHNNRDIEKQNFIIGYIGRKEKYKGIDLLVDSLQYLDNDIEYECKLYGDDFIKYEKKHTKIKNKGTYQRHELECVMRGLDVLIVPSIWKETFGFVTLEALSYKIPVIVTDNVGSKILLKNCQLNPIVEANAVSLSEKINEFIKNPNLLIEYKNWIENLEDIFSMNLHTQKILTMYKERII